MSKWGVGSVDGLFLSALDPGGQLLEFLPQLPLSDNYNLETEPLPLPKLLLVRICCHRPEARFSKRKTHNPCVCFLYPGSETRLISVP